MLILQKFFVSISLFKRIFIVMRQVIKKNVEALVKMIDKMRSSNEAPVLMPQDEDIKNKYLRIMRKNSTRMCKWIEIPLHHV